MKLICCNLLWDSITTYFIYTSWVLCVGWHICIFGPVRSCCFSKKKFENSTNCFFLFHRVQTWLTRSESASVPSRRRSSTCWWVRNNVRVKSHCRDKWDNVQLHIRCLQAVDLLTIFKCWINVCLYCGATVMMAIKKNTHYL